MGLLALAIAPGLAIAIYIYFKDKFNKEPLWLLVFSFILGIVSIVPAIIAESSSKISLNNMANEPTLNIAFFAYIVVGGSEEISKFLMVRIFLFKRSAFDDPFDGIVYCVMVSMGFATIENIAYVVNGGLTTAILRMFLSVPAHATFGILMGYFVGLAKFQPNKGFQHMVVGVLLAIFFHGTFDFFIFISKDWLQVIGAIISFFVAIYLSKKAIKRHQAYSAQVIQSRMKSNDEEPVSSNH
ncbi:MAG: PrsW family intramembrane metalloprotease [Ferruginibacter sp.]